MEIREVMTEHPQCCDMNASANDAARIMWERDCGAVPITDESGRVAGIVTDRDICMAAYFQGLALSDIRLADIMTRRPCTFSEDGDLRAAEQLMQEHQIRRLPIVDRGGSLVGIVSLADVTRAVTRNGAMSERGEVNEFCQTVAAVSEPRRSDSEDGLHA